MKKLFLLVIFFVSCKICTAQNQNTDPNAPPSTFSGTYMPTMSGPPYDGGNPVITNPGFTLAPPPNLNVPTPSTINYTDPTNPTSNSYKGTPTPSGSLAPITPTTNKNTPKK